MREKWLDVWEACGWGPVCGGGAVGVVGALRVAGFGRFVEERRLGKRDAALRASSQRLNAGAGRCPKPARRRPCHQRGGAT